MAWNGVQRDGIKSSGDLLEIPDVLRFFNPDIGAVAAVL